MPTTILGLILGALVVGFVAYPLLRPRHRHPQREADSGRTDLLAQKEEAYQAIKDLEFDRAMGKVSGEDFQEMEKELKGQAASLLKAMEKPPPPE
ncbi:MAG: hypothetical protein HYX86_01945 [Chloroflexi bacterium]|nr:hypothetical protein [Chloroflexota bacterium]